MSNKKDNFITFILGILIIVIFGATVYFCLDVFGIIQVPEKYSIASLFYSQIEVIATGGEKIKEDITPEELLNSVFSLIDKKDVSNEVKTEEVSSSNVESPLKALEKSQNENNNTNNQFNSDSTEKYFYYNQLDQYGREIYDQLYKDIDKLKTGTYTANYGTTFNDLLHEENGKEVLDNAFQLAINALTFDNPELFYIDITKINLVTEITTRAFSTTYKISIGGNGKSYLAEEFSDINNLNNSIDNIKNIKNDIINIAKRENDIIGQIKSVHDYLVDNIEYDLNKGRNVYNIYGALIDKKAVCEGYARAYKDILDDMGIPCIIACGTARNKKGVTENHAWNYVKINENWYAVDVTWDDPIITGYGKLTDENRYKYFLSGSDSFFEDHFEDGNIVGQSNFSYPILSKIDY